MVGPGRFLLLGKRYRDLLLLPRLWPFDRVGDTIFLTALLGGPTLLALIVVLFVILMERRSEKDHESDRDHEKMIARLDAEAEEYRQAAINEINAAPDSKYYSPDGYLGSVLKEKKSEEEYEVELLPPIHSNSTLSPDDKLPFYT